MRTILLVFAAALLAGALWLLISSYASTPSFEPLQMTNIIGFDSSLKVPPEEAKKVLEQAEAVLDREGKQAKTDRNWAGALDWLSFILTAGVTVLAGWFGKGSNVASPPYPTKLLGFVGAAAAIASVATGAGSKMTQNNQTHLKNFTTVSSAIDQTRDVLDDGSKSPREQQKALDNLKRTLAQI